MGKLLIIGALSALASVGVLTHAADAFVDSNFNFIESQLPLALKSTQEAQDALKAAGKLRSGLGRQVIMRTVAEDGSLNIVGSNDWTCGYFPGLLWYVYEYSKNPKWAAEATRFTQYVEPAKMIKSTHDIGIMIYSCFGNAYRLTGKEEFKQVVITAADTLMTRFDPRVGLIRSWDFNKAKWNYPVIIDNMIVLELLCAASKWSGDPKYLKVAISHADKTMQNHFRKDYSSFHVVDYDDKGKAVQFNTDQGYSDGSAWARGQAWALYGYTMMYRETQDPQYLDQAEKIAHFILTHPRLPEDKIPYWDFDDPDIPKAPRDVSTACIMASAFYEMSTYSDKGAMYKAVADEMLRSIHDKYLAKANGDYGFITTDSVGRWPYGQEISVPLNYADYYFAEALLRKKKLEESGKLF